MKTERLQVMTIYKKQTQKWILTIAVLAVFLICSASCSNLNAASNSSLLTQRASVTEQDIPAKIEEMAMQYYEDDNLTGRWPYLHWIITNTSEKTISDYEMVCLAYDQEGQPLELVWQQLMLTKGDQITRFVPQSEKSYQQSITLANKSILPNAKENLDGGWSLFDGWHPTTGTHDVAYVLTCMKQVTFEDGTAWENPEYQNWLSKYKGKTVDLNTLDTYYA